MKFPIDEQKFIDRWLSALNDPDEGGQGTGRGYSADNQPGILCGIRSWS